MSVDPDGLYARLGVPPTASAAEIAAAYRRQARVLHPDVADTGDTQAFVALRQAFDVLADLQRRASYDRMARTAALELMEIGEIPPDPPVVMPDAPVPRPRISDLPLALWIGAALLIGVGVFETTAHLVGSSGRDIAAPATVARTAVADATLPGSGGQRLRGQRVDGPRVDGLTAGGRVRTGGQNAAGDQPSVGGNSADGGARSDVDADRGATAPAAAAGTVGLGKPPHRETGRGAATTPPLAGQPASTLDATEQPSLVTAEPENGKLKQQGPEGAGAEGARAEGAAPMGAVPDQGARAADNQEAATQPAPVRLAGTPNFYIVPASGPTVLWRVDAERHSFVPIGQMPPFSAVQALRLFRQNGLMEVRVTDTRTALVAAVRLAPGDVGAARRAYCTYYAGAPPANGEVLERHAAGVSSLDMSNHTDQPVVVKLRDDTNVLAASVFLAPRGTATVTGLPGGRFRPDFAIGELWSRACNGFAAGMRAQRFAVALPLDALNPLAIPPQPDAAPPQEIPDSQFEGR